VLWKDLSELNKVIDRIAPLADVLFVTNEDDTHLFGSRPSHDTVKDYAGRGYGEIALRRGGAHTLVKCSEGEFEVPVPHVQKIIDSTGAGDAFDAGYIAAMLRGLPTYECASLGNAAAAATLETRGGRATGLTIERVEKLYRPLVKWGTFHVPVRHA
jgi:2-dehydro-3-deoxygluconokinase